MSYEIYSIELKQELTKEEKAHIATLRKVRAAAQSAGLAHEVTSAEMNIVGIERGGLIVTPALTQAELEILRAWLPVRYGEHVNQYPELNQYSSGRMPAPVLMQMEEYTKSGIFDHLVIWNTGSPSEPLDKGEAILLGVNGHTRHLIARWSELDEPLLSFTEIRNRVTLDWYKENVTADVIPWSLIAVALVVTVILSAMYVGITNGLQAQNMHTLYLLWSLMGLLTFGGVRYVRKRSFQRAVQSSSVMRGLIEYQFVERTPLIESDC